MKFVKIFLMLSFFCLADFYNFSEVLKISRENLLDFVGETVKSWNRNHSNSNDVVIFNIGKNDDDAAGIAKRVSSENAIISPTHGQILKVSKPSFIIILSDLYDKVCAFLHVFQGLFGLFCIQYFIRIN